MKVDILIGVAEKGGGENIINMLVPFLEKTRNWKIRVVQLIWEDYVWTNEGILFYPLLHGRQGHTLEELVATYASFLSENGCPDVVLATAWPYMCYIGKKAAAICGAKQMKIISWLHAPVERYEKVGFGGYSYLALADAHLAISGTIAEGIESHLPGSKMLPVRNPVDFDNCVVVQTERCDSNIMRKKLYFVGRISEEKRLDVVIRSLCGINEIWNLTVIGDGEEQLKEKLRELASRCHVAESVQWLGWKSNPWEHVKNADALVLASEFEGFPLVAIEALGNGIPVISTPVSGIREVIVPGMNGYLYPKGDWKSLNEILSLMAAGRLPEINPEKCKESVKHHRKEEALLDFANKVENLVVTP